MKKITSNYQFKNTKITTQYNYIFSLVKSLMENIFECLPKQLGNLYYTISVELNTYLIYLTKKFGHITLESIDFIDYYKKRRLKQLIVHNVHTNIHTMYIVHKSHL